MSLCGQRRNDVRTNMRTALLIAVLAVIVIAAALGLSSHGCEFDTMMSGFKAYC
jgi:hypothetical protein